MSNLVLLFLLQFHMESIVEQPELLPSRLHANDNHILKNANKLHDFLLKCPNAVVVDDQVSFSWVSI